ncbi:hypothetical protein HY500_01105 [Candidatus Woesearchaeota archaeon]|nr:hypothetical protein [Candidatus Woesearchaeota archaeon]
MKSLKVYGLALLLTCCAPKSSIIYMAAEIDNPTRITYSVSDDRNEIKGEIFREQEEQGQIPISFLEEMIKETDRRGLVVQVERFEEKIEVSVYAPILYSIRRNSERYFKAKVKFYDKDLDGRIDIAPKARKKFRHSIKVCEDILKKEKKRKY